jgi:hypothetical protein
MPNTITHKTINTIASVIVLFLSFLFFPIIGIFKFYKNLKGVDFVEESHVCYYENFIDRANKTFLNFSSSLVLILLKMVFMPLVILYKASIKSTQTNKLFRELLSANID